MIGVGVVGCGLIGAKRAAALPPGMRLLAVHDQDRGRAEALALRHEGVHVAGTLAELLAEPGLTLVIVATTHQALPEVGLAAVEAGAHVLLEKPGAGAVAPLLEVRQAAAQRGVIVRVGFNHRFHPSFQQLQALRASRDDGRLLSIRARYGHGGRIGYEQEWRAVRSISGGGELIDQGVHLIDLVRFSAGDVELAFAELRTDFWAMDVEDNAYVALRPTQGGFAWLHASWTEWKNTFSFEVSGLGGSYGVEELTLFAMQPEMGPPPSTTWRWPAQDSSWRLELEDVARALSGEPARGASIDDAIANLTLIDEAYQR